jgi:hypothetical protein
MACSGALVLWCFGVRVLRGTADRTGPLPGLPPDRATRRRRLLRRVHRPSTAGHRPPAAVGDRWTPRTVRLPRRARLKRGTSVSNAVRDTRPSMSSGTRTHSRSVCRNGRTRAKGRPQPASSSNVSPRGPRPALVGRLVLPRGVSYPWRDDERAHRRRALKPSAEAGPSSRHPSVGQDIRTRGVCGAWTGGPRV